MSNIQFIVKLEKSFDVVFGIIMIKSVWITTWPLLQDPAMLLVSPYEELQDPRMKYGK